jgi:hypothetical protein
VAVPDQEGWFEVGLALGDAGKEIVHVWRTARGSRGGDVVRKVKLEARRDGDVTRYEARLSGAAFGLSETLLAQGVRFSFVVNDLDEPGGTAAAPAAMREGYLRLSEGIASDKDPQRFPTVVIE